MGREGDCLVDFDDTDRAYCSCYDFHFRVLSGSVPSCYHLLAARLARAESKFETISFADEEFEGFLRALVSDIASNLRTKNRKISSSS